MKLILVGLPGSGKSTVGKLVARQLNLPFVDADRFLEQQIGRRIPEIFASDGEEAFRALESRILRQLCAGEDMVLSTGGGAVLRQENRELLRRSGLVIFLDRSPWAIRRTLKTSNRPVITDEEAIFRLSRQRRGLYRACAMRSVNAPTAKKAAEKVCAIWKEQQA